MNNYNVFYDWNHNNRNNLSFNGQENYSISQDLYNPKEGFEKGNLFQNLYLKYKNYNPKRLQPRNEQEEKQFELQAITFAIHELNLYLDIHPEDQSMLMLFQDYMKKKEKLLKEYESKYGLITLGNNNNLTNSFLWANNDWPWEGLNV